MKTWYAICANEYNMKLRLIKLSIIILIIFLTQACSSTRVISFHNDNANFGKFNTYRIDHPYDDQTPINDRVKQVTENIESKIAQELESRKYKPSESPDLIARYRINLNPNSQTDINNNRGFIQNGYLPYYDPYFIDTRTYDYVEGIVLVELMDRSNRKLVWQASKDVKFNPRRESSDAIIFETINEIFETYHYLAGSNKPVLN